MLKKLLFPLLVCFFFNLNAQNIDGLWRGTFVMYLHNTYEVEMDLIDFGAEELTWDDETHELIVQVAFTDFGMMQNGLEEKKYTVKETIKTFIPTTTKELTEEEEIEFKKMIDKMEEDDDVMAVYHNIA